MTRRANTVPNNKKSSPKRKDKENNELQTTKADVVSNSNPGKHKKKKKDKDRDRDDTEGLDGQTVDGSEKKKKKNESTSNSRNKKKSSKARKNKTKTEQETCDDDKPSKKKVAPRHTACTTAQIENYHTFIKETCNIGVQGIVKQFNDYLKAYVPPGASCRAFEKHQDKNRYKDVICLDANRIILKGKHDADYIHANMIESESLCNKFICTQGPLHTTTHDFWKMCLQEKSQVIIMLCQTWEMDREKCHQYWPKDKGHSMTFKDIVIKNVEIDKNSDNTTTISTLHVTSKKETDPVSIKHYHWTNWPDRSVPQSVMAPFRILKAARSSKYPAVVHCSAGVGRTGAFVGIEMALQNILMSKPTSLTQIVQELRMKRMHCVQTDLQLVYMYRCLLAFADSSSLLKGAPDLDARCKIFTKEYDALIQERMTVPPQKRVAATPKNPSEENPPGPVPMPAVGGLVVGVSNSPQQTPANPTTHVQQNYLTTPVIQIPIPGFPVSPPAVPPLPPIVPPPVVGVPFKPPEPEPPCPEAPKQAGDDQAALKSFYFG